MGTGAKGGDPPKNNNKNNQLLGVCSGGNHGGGPRGPCGEVPLTPNPDSNPVTNHCKNLLYRGGFQPLADAHMTVPPAEATKKGWRGTITNLRQQGGKGGNSPNPTISFSTNQPNAPSLAARKHYRVGQSNLTFLFRQGSSRGKGGRRAAPPLAARAGESQVFSRGWVIHRGVWGVTPLPSLQPTRCRVWRGMVHRDQPQRGSWRELERRLHAATTGRVRLPKA